MNKLEEIYYTVRSALKLLGAPPTLSFQMDRIEIGVRGDGYFETHIPCYDLTYSDGVFSLTVHYPGKFAQDPSEYTDLEIASGPDHEEIIMTLLQHIVEQRARLLLAGNEDCESYCK